MKNRDSKEWIWPPLSQWVITWGMPLFAAGSFIAAEFLLFFMRLKGLGWIRCYTLALLLAAAGIALIFFAKLPLYRQRRFLTFGSRLLPAERRRYYHWGYILAWLSVGLLAGLFLSRP